MSSRRQFLELSAKLAAAGCILRLPAAASTPPTAGMDFGVQMFMVRQQAASDLAGAFQAIRDAGFSAVELYPIAYKHPAPELRRMVADAGLRSISGHFDYAGPLSGPGAGIDYAHSLGLQYVVCPMLPHDQWNSLDGFRKAADFFNHWGEAAHAAGMQFTFHNHDYEFKPIDGSYGFAELMKGTDPNLVKLEFDLYWLTQAGQDPAAMLARHADRVVLIHLKDRIANAPTSYNMDPPQQFTELGRGSIDWPTLLKQAQRQGIRHAFLDQDETTGPIPASMRRSHEYLASIRI